jgi:hypothetical protein
MAGPIEKFALQLLAGTKAGTVEWKPGPTSEILLLEGQSGLVQLEKRGEDKIQLHLFNAQGNSVGSVESDPSRAGPWQPWETALRELFPIASLQARGTTEVLTGLQEEFNLPDDVDESDDVPF